MNRDAPVEANRVFEDMRAMVRWARGRGDLDENLTEGMKAPAETAERDRVLSPHEIRAFWHGLADAKMDASTARLLKLILATMARPGEVAGMVAQELDLEKRLWRIPPGRSKNKREHILPLSDLAMGLIKEQLAEVRAAAARRKGRLDRQLDRLIARASPIDVPMLPEWVFPGAGARAPVTEGVPSKAIKRNSNFGTEPFRPHDLRRTAATRCEEIGISPFIVAHLLGHVSVTKADVTSKVYARYDYAREKREAIDKWGAHLRGIIEGAATVHPFGQVA
jgi:integrase